MSNPGYRRKCPLCSSWYFICAPCDRWHWYCSTPCKSQARKASQDKATRKYRRAGRGKKANREAQARHRARKRAKKRVIYQSSGTLPLSSKIFGKLDGRAEIPNQGQEEPPNVDATEVATTSPVEESLVEQATASSDQTTIKNPLKARPNPITPKTFSHLGICRVCRRGITHIITSDLLDKPGKQRGPPCNPMR